VESGKIRKPLIRRGIGPAQGAPNRARNTTLISPKLRKTLPASSSSRAPARSTKINNRKKQQLLILLSFCTPALCLAYLEIGVSETGSLETLSSSRESLQTFGSSRAATADRVSLATMLYPFIGLCSWRALFRVVYAGANAAGIGQLAIGIVIGE
jgi:hypothetical protein